MSISNIKQELSRVFDDNLHTKQWHNWVDYAIIGLIIISTIEVFVSTYDSMVARFGAILHVIDYATTFIFTIEVVLRIWCADMLDKRYKGFWGRVRYCFSFYGLIDILSTFPFYLSFFFNIPYVALKALRIARLLRIFRYIKAFNILSRAISSKKDEMVVSVQFLAIVTLLLSFILFFVEHEAQPEVYDNGWKSVVWAFAQYIGDPGGFADTPPITFIGRIIACIIGVLGIAIFAVPAGLIGSGFSEIMEVDARKRECKENIAKVRRAFERKLDRPTGYQIVPHFISIPDIQARMNLNVEDVIDAIGEAPDLRLINLAVTQTVDEHPQDRLAVEHFMVNRSYGCCIDRGSRITIISPSNIVDPVNGHFAFYLALIGGFNYISREIGESRPYKSFFKFDDASAVPGLEEYMRDLNSLTSRKDSWAISILAMSGGNEPSYPTQIEFVGGGEKGNESIELSSPHVKDKIRLTELVEDATLYLKQRFDIDSCYQRYHGIGINPHKHYATKLDNWEQTNAISIHVAWAISCWDSRHIAIAKTLAELIAKDIEGCTELNLSPVLKRKDCGYDDYKE